MIETISPETVVAIPQPEITIKRETLAQALKRVMSMPNHVERATALKAVIEHFAADLKMICGVKLTVQDDFFRKTAANPSADIDWQLQRSLLKTKLLGLILKVNYGDAIREKFSLLQDDRKVHTLTLSHTSRKSPDDFVRKIPTVAQRKLKVLQRTHFDYRPKILEGRVAEETIERKRPVMEVLEDPALVIEIANQTYAITRWVEPFPSEARRLVTRFTSHPIWDLIVATLLFLGGIGLVVVTMNGLVQTTWYGEIGMFLASMGSTVAWLFITAFASRVFRAYRTRDEKQKEVILS